MTLQIKEPTPTPLAILTTRQQATWASADFSVIGTTLQIVAETLCEAADVRARERVLDVACGSGNGAIAAARRFGDVTGIDYVPALIDKAKVRAEAEGLSVDVRTADAQALPFADASFDVVLSTFGVMFAPDHHTAGAELVRVCRPGGRVALASWTPGGFVGELLRLVGRFAPPPPGLASPLLWGTRDHIEALIGDSVASISAQKRYFDFRYASATHFIDVFRTYYGPMRNAFAVLDERGRAELERELEILLTRYDHGGVGLVVPGEYLEVVAVRRGATALA